MTWPTRRTSTANWTADRQFRSAWTTTLATFRWTNISPGGRPTIWLAGTRLSEHPIHRYRGACWRDRRSKKSGSCRVMSAAHARLFANRWSGALIRVFYESAVGGVRPPARPRTVSRPPSREPAAVRRTAGFGDTRCPLPQQLATRSVALSREGQPGPLQDRQNPLGIGADVGDRAMH